MSELMPMDEDLPYVCIDRGMVYFRKRGCRKVRIRESRGTPEFHRRYAELLEQSKAGELRPPPSDAPVPGTWRWLCVQYISSDTGLAALDPSTQRVRRQVIEGTWDESIAPGDPLRFADCPLDRFNAKAVRVLRDRKKDFPEAANVRLKAIRRIFKWAIEEEVGNVTSNPARDVGRLKPKRIGGHHAWTIDEIEQFEKRHELGTKAHLAMTLLIHSGGRRGDVVGLGRQHIRNGRLRYTQEKNRRRHPVTVDIAIPADLHRVLEVSPVGDLTFLGTEFGRPFSKAGFGNKFRQWCNEAGLPHCSAHGLRKAAATRVAENGGTTSELKAIFGWRSDKEAERYTQAADRKRLGSGANRLLARPKP
jgi:integrase